VLKRLDATLTAVATALAAQQGPALPPAPEEQPLLCAKQVAKRLSVSVRTLFRLIDRGVLPQPLKSGHKLTRWGTADVAVAIERMRQQP